MAQVELREAQFRSMLTEWSAVRSRVHADISQWEERVSELAQDEARLRAVGRWTSGRNDVLGVIGKHRDELVHSRMIGWLLDPTGRHGLGSAVLLGLLKKFAASDDATLLLNRARVRFEVVVDEGRLDVVVTAPNLALVIENKVDAEEADQQCPYYSERLPSTTICVLLSPDGRGSRHPSSFQPLRYATFAEILRQALWQTMGDTPGRRIAEDYLRTLELEFQ